MYVAAVVSSSCDPAEWFHVCRCASPQVHALNILRALYRDTRLGENVIPFVSDGMQAAVLGFTSPVWAVSLEVFYLLLLSD